MIEPGIGAGATCPVVIRIRRDNSRPRLQRILHELLLPALPQFTEAVGDLR
jgi:hypothetical protein